jgi:hypothetical protein
MEYQKKKKCPLVDIECFAILLATRLIKLVIKLDDFLFYHSDIKPSNVILFEDKGVIRFKLMGFVVSNLSWSQLAGFTPKYFFSPRRIYKPLEMIKVDSYPIIYS